MLHAHCTSALSSGFLISQGNAEALDRRGGKTKHSLISYFFGNTSAKNYLKRIVCVKIIASRRWNVFLSHGVVISLKVLKLLSLITAAVTRVCICFALAMVFFSKW